VAYLVDTSAYARLATSARVFDVLAPLMAEGVVAVSGVVVLEAGYSARDAAEHEAVQATLSSFPWVGIEHSDWARAWQVQHALAARGQHRSARLPDLLVAAAAERAGLTVLHYDRDFETVAAVTGQPTEWVVPRGSVD